MELLIDSADIELIKTIYNHYPVDGVTCNPTILMKTGRNPYAVLKEIRNFIGDEAQLHVQVISTQASNIIDEAKHICSVLGMQTYIKIPVNKEGLKAISHLAKEGYHITATAIYNQMQGFLAAKSGAHYVAPYVNRIDNLGYNGVSIAFQIHKMIKEAQLDTKVLAASFKNSYQVHELLLQGIESVTIAPEMFDGLIGSETINQAINQFVSDFEKLCGHEKTMLDCEN